MSFSTVAASCLTRPVRASSMLCDERLNAEADAIDSVRAPVRGRRSSASGGPGAASMVASTPFVGEWGEELVEGCRIDGAGGPSAEVKGVGIPGIRGLNFRRDSGQVLLFEAARLHS